MDIEEGRIKLRKPCSLIRLIVWSRCLMLAAARFDEALAPRVKKSLLEILVSCPLAKMKMPPVVNTRGHFSFKNM
jgi:hypothetical protein